MRTDLGTKAFDDAFVSDSDLIGYDSPREIVEDQVLSLGRKRQLLAFWGSDIHAIAGAPALRCCASGPIVTIREIKDALSALDEMVDVAAMPTAQTSSVAA